MVLSDRKSSLNMKSNAHTVQEYIESLLPERREAISKVRGVILKNLPAGYEEGIQYGMIGYYVPLARYPRTYNNQPLGIAALASQKSYMSLYLMSVYGNKETERWFLERYRASGKKLDMGKSCVRFRRLEDLPLDLVGKVIARTSVDAFIEIYEAARNIKRS